MDLTPEEANDYARIIYQKGSAAQESTATCSISQGAVGRGRSSANGWMRALARQALAEQDKAVQESGLTVKPPFPSGSCPFGRTDASCPACWRISSATA
ncbi:MAG: hypothetical protein ACLUDF_06445 [Butyricicoccus sp.]